MCILFIYRNPNPSPGGYRLILVANRDEFYTRPAKPAHLWDHQDGSLGGIDMEPGREGGTWLALNFKTGRAGVILNLTGAERASNAKGRGSLITNYLDSKDSTLSYASNLHNINQEFQLYNPYNLVMVDLRSVDVYYLSSLKNFTGPKTMNEEILGFGNSSLDKPYKKVTVGKEKFKEIVTKASSLDQEQLIEKLISFLKQEEKHLPDPELVKRSPEAYELLSSIFVKHESAGYGTRTHSILMIDEFSQMTFVEDTMMPDKTWKRQIFFKTLENK